MACLPFEQLPWDHVKNGGTKHYYNSIYDDFQFYDRSTHKLKPNIMSDLEKMIKHDREYMGKEKWLHVCEIIKKEYYFNDINSHPFLYFLFLIKMKKINDFNVDHNHFKNNDNLQLLKERFFPINNYYYIPKPKNPPKLVNREYLDNFNLLLLD